MKMKIYERNSMTGVIRWRYINERGSWPHYGRILNDSKKKRIRKSS